MRNLKLTHLTCRWSLQLVTTIRRCHQQSGRNLVFMSTSMVPVGDCSVTLDHFSRCHWLVVSPSLTERLSRATCFPGICKPPAPCQCLRERFYHSLTLLSQERTFCSFVLDTLPSNYFSSLLSFLFLPFRVGPP